MSSAAQVSDKGEIRIKLTNKAGELRAKTNVSSSSVIISSIA